MLSFPDSAGQVFRAPLRDTAFAVPAVPAAGSPQAAVSDLFSALVRRDVPAFAALLEILQVDQSTRDDNGNTPLHAAVHSAHPALVTTFLQSRHGGHAGVLHALDARGDTAMWNAVRHGHVEMVAALQQAGAQINARDKRGETPLTDAVMTHRMDMVRALIAAGADVNVCNDVASPDEDEATQNSPLMLAMRAARPDMVAALIAAGADVNACNDIFATPLTFARLDDVSMANADAMADAAQQLIHAGADLMVRHHESFADAALAHLATCFEPLHALLTQSDARTDAQAYRRLNALVDAAERGDLDQVRRLVHDVADINARVERGATALCGAAHFGNEKVVAALIQAGAGVDATDGFGQTPLMLAARNSFAGFEFNYLRIVQALMAAGADVNARDWNGNTALMLDGMLCRWSTHITIALAKAGVDLDARSYRGETALLAAVRLGAADFASLLMQCGADINIPSHRGWTALMHVARKWGGLAPWISAGADVHARNHHGQTALFIASSHGRESAVAALVHGKADVNATDNKGMTPLMVAAQGGCARTARVLVQARARIDASDKAGMTLLMHAVRHGRRDIAALLLARTQAHARELAAARLQTAEDHSLAQQAADAAVHAAVNARDFYNNTVLLHAARGEARAWETMQLLIAAGADIHAQNDAGQTPLTVVVRHNNPAAAIGLLGLGGAQIEAVDARGMTALMHAASNASQALLLQLIQAGSRPGIWKRGGYINAGDRHGATALMHAAANGNPVAVRLLLDATADIHACDRTGATALLHAARSGHRDVVELLLERDADINACDAKGVTALMLAAMHGRLPVVVALLDGNADVCMEDHQHDTALLHAAVRGYEAIVHVLQARGALQQALRMERR